MDLNALTENFAHSLQDLEMDVAIARIEEKLNQKIEEDERIEILIMKAHYLSRMNEQFQAVAILSELVSVNQQPNAPYFLAENLIEQQQYLGARGALDLAIARSTENGSNWFINEAILLRAYCLAKLGCFDSASKDLARTDEPGPIFWLKTQPEISRQSIFAMLNETRGSVE